MGDGQVEAPPRGEPVELVLLDVGGPIYDDACYLAALRRAAEELRGEPVEESELRAVYDARRQAQQGGFRAAIAERFLPGGDPDALGALTQRYWEYPASALYDDVRPALEQLRGRHRLAVVANQREHVMHALRRDDLVGFFDVIALSEEVGVAKPDPGIFRYALQEAGVPAARAVHVGNRLDTDVRAARRVGLRTVWVLRGEAPPRPTPEQRAEADVSIASLAELPAAVAALAGEESG